MLFESRGLLEQFRRQFSEEDGGKVYRRYGKGAGYYISEEQRSEWTDRFRRRQRRPWMYLTLGLSAVIPMFITLEVLVFAKAEVEPWRIAAGTLLVVAPASAWALVASRRAMVEPARELENVAPAFPAYSEAEWRRKCLGEMSWRTLSLAPLAGLLVVWRMSEEFDIWHGWGRLAWLAPAGLLVLSAVQALRKFRLTGQNTVET